MRKDVLRNFAKFTGKHLFQSLFFNKAAGLHLWTLLLHLVIYVIKYYFTVFPITFLSWLLTREDVSVLIANYEK